MRFEFHFDFWCNFKNNNRIHTCIKFSLNIFIFAFSMHHITFSKYYFDILFSHMRFWFYISYYYFFFFKIRLLIKKNLLPRSKT